MILSYSNVKSVVVCGDIHGDFETLVYKITIQYQLENTLVIVAGDCGFGFEKSEYYEQIFNRIQKRLSSRNNWIVMIRGNHDNPLYFNGEYRITHKRWCTIPDYTVLQVDNHNILCVGGAISIDRFLRKQEMLIRQDRELYWADEAPFLSKDILEILRIKGINIDTIITHTAPSFCDLQTKSGLEKWALYDEKLLEDCNCERSVMDAIFEKLRYDGHNLKCWYYAHFHQSRRVCIDGIKYVMLDIMELHELL